jgi:hypothetical protein
MISENSVIEIYLVSLSRYYLLDDHSWLSVSIFSSILEVNLAFTIFPALQTVWSVQETDVLRLSYDLKIIVDTFEMISNK